MSPDDRAVLHAFGLSPDALLGSGGEACVYALDAERALRVPRSGARPAELEARVALLNELQGSASRVPFEIPAVLESHEVAGRRVIIERRLPGRPMEDALPELERSAREALVRSYLDAAAQVGELVVGGSGFGELMRPDALRTSTFCAYLEQSAARSLRAAAPEFQTVEPAALARDLPEPATAALVHLDVFPANVLVLGERVVSLLDFSVLAIRGDRRLDPLAAAVYLEPVFTKAANDADRDTARAWLEEHELARWHAPARRWLAAFWSAASSIPKLEAWSRSVLLEGAEVTF